ncbi:ATP-binding protein [Paenibacillus allorhizosphaerae]|uniref:Adaptive-response sensory-kinase SasA n=1 Tax=Paenibacillus allorhizosphaerae TaxID=2849866 RepID=A0ABN7TEX5_9BACL|nr:ATP-binding protein [Paenibacillus allorhizosphaerae]CAG7622009.1 Adaptive-response sensory-kinase SasA [Paenibacillus allorhizosphaerae]
MNSKWICIVYSFLVLSSSLYFGTSASPLWLVAATAGYVLAQTFEKHIPARLPLQLILLIAMHSLSGTLWCLPLYLLHMCNLFYNIPSFRTALWINTLLMLTGVIVALVRQPAMTETTLTTAYSIISCFIFACLYRKIYYDIEHQKQQLTNEKKHLSTHDALTGLYNFQEFHKQLEKLGGSGEPVILVLMDCKDLKSLNTTNGFQGVNKILKQVAQLLRIIFPEAELICRYGGDEFAIVLKTEDVDQSIHSVTQQMAVEFPKLTGIEINFGIASYPSDGMAKDDLILVAEHNLYMMKRESWLKREEHMLRSEKLRVVGELASGMAHEIRNPLTTVKGFLQLSKAGNYNIEPWYDLIMDEINRMSMLTVEFLQFSRPHVTQFKIQSIQNCVFRVLSLLDSETTRLGHHVQFDHDEEPVLMLMDHDKMLQLLLNLIKNAFEAMPEEGRVHIHLYTLEKQAVIEISDNGKGIPESDLEKVFIPFYTTKDSGTGLGLSICHKIVQDHEGTIEVESFVNKGTKFTIMLPTVGMQQPEAAATSGGTKVSV